MTNVIRVDFRTRVRITDEYGEAIARLDRAATRYPDCAASLKRLRNAYEQRRREI